MGDANADQADLDGDGDGDVCDEEDAQIEVTRATVWRTRSKLGRMKLDGTIPAGVYGPADVLSHAGGFSIHVTDAIELDQQVDFGAGDRETLRSGRMRCRLPDRSSKVILIPVSGSPGAYRFEADLRRLDIDRPQEGPVAVSVRHGDVDRNGSIADCRVYNAKLVCRD